MGRLLDTEGSLPFSNGTGYHSQMNSHFHHFLLRLIPFLGLVAAMPAAVANSSLPESLLDSWSARFQVGNYPPLELVFHLSRDEDGTLAAELDIPSQYRTGIPAQRATLNEQRITLYFPDIQAEFMGSISLHETNGHVEYISGDWSQSGEFVTMRLRRHASDD